MSDPCRPIVVDLDGTLIASDLLVETASDLLARRPLAALHAIGSLREGRAALKHRLATDTPLDVTVLPYRTDVLAWLEQRRAEGHPLVLASASDVRLVRAVAAHLGLFSDVIGSENGVNLKSAVKRDELLARYPGGFEYVGNHRHDVAVWSAASVSHVVGDRGLLDGAGTTTTVGEVFAPPARGLRPVLRALRPHQWVKNALVAVPLGTAQLLGEADAVLATVLAVIAFCAVASGVYVLNDLADLSNDRRHPIKRNRPFAAGTVSLMLGWALWPVLTAVGFAIAVAFLPAAFVAVLGGYLVLTLAYTFWGKRRPVVDVISLGGLYTIRIAAGAAALAVPLSIWLLTFSLLFFLSLALLKRVSELTRIRNEGSSMSGRGYLPQDLELVSSYGVASSIGAVVVFSLYVNDPQTADLYATPEVLWLTVPVLLAWLMRAWLWAHRGQMNEDPILFAIKDGRSIVAGALIVAAFVAAKVIGA